MERIAVFILLAIVGFYFFFKVVPTISSVCVLLCTLTSAHRHFLTRLLKVAVNCNRSWL